jgi:hypothetical protein
MLGNQQRLQAARKLNNGTIKKDRIGVQLMRAIKGK